MCETGEPRVFFLTPNVKYQVYFRSEIRKKATSRDGKFNWLLNKPKITFVASTVKPTVALIKKNAI